MRYNDLNDRECEIWDEGWRIGIVIGVTFGVVTSVVAILAFFA